MMENCFTPQEQAQIESAIAAAEKNSSAEVRVCITERCKGDAVKCAAKAFKRLGMEKTAQRNGVLIYIAMSDRKVAIIGDKGINDLVEADFWDSVYRLMVQKFSAGHIADGIAAACAEVGVKLKAFFPYQSDDKNELSDQIVYEG